MADNEIANIQDAEIDYFPDAGKAVPHTITLTMTVDHDDKVEGVVAAFKLFARPVSPGVTVEIMVDGEPYEIE